jgi:hypothetical protein
VRAGLVLAGVCAMAAAAGAAAPEETLAGPPLEIVEARDGVVTLTCDSSACAPSFRVVSLMGREAELMVLAASLTDPGGAVHRVGVDPRDRSSGRSARSP